MKRYIISLFVAGTILGGCTDNSENAPLKETKETTSEVREVQKEEKEAVTSPEEAAQDAVQKVATNFAKEFFTTQGKAAENIVGGAEYIHPELREPIAMWMIDSVFPVLPAGDKNLVVSDVVVNNITKLEDVTINGVAVESYSMEVIVSYQDNKTSVWNYIPNLQVSKINNTWQITGLETPEGDAPQGDTWYKDPTTNEQK